MATIRSNGLLKVIIPAAVIGAVAIAYSGRDDSSSDTPAQAAQGTSVRELTSEEKKRLGMDGAQDTVSALVARIDQMRDSQSKSNQLMQQLLEENDTLRQKAGDVEGAASTAVSSQLASAKNELMGQVGEQLSQFENRMNTVTSQLNAVGSDGAVSGSSMGGAGSVSLPADASQGGVVQLGGETYMWIEPQDMRKTDANGMVSSTGSQFSFPSSFGEVGSLADKGLSSLNSATNGAAAQVLGSTAEEDAVPVYTVAENATLMGSVSMTALLGRIPINGSVQDPYPFKIIIGSDNLMANGIELPDVAQAVVSGVATGDWVLSCVRGSITSITFVFTDGTIRTLNGQSEEGGQSGQGNGASASGAGAQVSSQSLGWLSDPYGIPCISGEKKSNAMEYLSTQFGLGMATAAASASAQSETTSVTGTDAVVTAVTGDAGKYALNSGIAGGLEKVSEWVAQRYGQTFDAIYVPPGQPVALHITRELKIDYELNGRKVSYLSGAGGRSRALD